MIIGITGTIGAGKGTVVTYLEEKKGFAHFSVRAYLTEEIERRGMPVNRDSMVIVGNDLRSTHGRGYLAEQLYERAATAGGDAIIESLRHPDEVEALRAKGSSQLWSVDAEPRTRYERVIARASETDRISWETFQENEAREMHSDDPNGQQIAAVMAMADAHISNDGTFDELYRQLDVLLDDEAFQRS